MIVVRPLTVRKRKADVLAEVRKEAKIAAREISLSLQEDVATWRHKPKFKETVTVSQRRVTIKVEPSGPNKKIYEYVDQGTKPHDIAPKRAGGVLRFKWGGPGSYTPKTLPGRGGSTNAYQTGGVVYRKKVHHPGTSARNFTRKIMRLYTPSLERRYQEAIDRAMAARKNT